MHRPTVQVYEHEGARYAVVAADPSVPAVQADVLHLPFARGAFAGIWASKAHQHLPAADLPMALAEAHRVLQVGGRLELTMFTGWDPARLVTVVQAAGFRVDHLDTTHPTGRDHAHIDLVATSQRALPDHVGAHMRLLCCGLNPSLHAADAGVGYVTGSNRFWKALAAAGLATRDRDPRHLLHHHRIGMTDLVKRATPRADELRAAEYREGVERLAALCTWLRPQAVAVVGLAGWRAAVDRTAAVGWQPQLLGPTPVYVLPSTSGLNAGTSLAQLVEHLQLAAAGPTRPPGGPGSARLSP